MARYTARHAHYSHKKHTHNWLNHEHNKHPAVRRLTALTAAAAALIGGGYTTNQGNQGRTIVTVEYSREGYTEKERREAGQIPFAIKVDGGHINTTTEPDTIGYTGSAVRISEDTTGISREAVACLPPHKPQPTPPSR